MHESRRPVPRGGGFVHKGGGGQLGGAAQRREPAGEQETPGRRAPPVGGARAPRFGGRGEAPS